MNGTDETTVGDHTTPIRSNGPEPFKPYFNVLFEELLRSGNPSSSRDTATVEAEIAAMSKVLAAPLSDGSDFRTANRDLLKRAASLTDQEIHTSSNTGHLPATPLEITHRFLLSKCCEVSDAADETIAKIMPPVQVEASWGYVSTILKKTRQGGYIRSRLSDLEEFVTPLAGMLILDQSQKRFTSGSEWVAELDMSWDKMMHNKRAARRKLWQTRRSAKQSVGSKPDSIASGGETPLEVIEAPCLLRDM